MSWLLLLRHVKALEPSLAVPHAHTNVSHNYHTLEVAARSHEATDPNGHLVLADTSQAKCDRHACQEEVVPKHHNHTMAQTVGLPNCCPSHQHQALAAVVSMVLRILLRMLHLQGLLL